MYKGVVPHFIISCALVSLSLPKQGRLELCGILMVNSKDYMSFA